MATALAAYRAETECSQCWPEPGRIERWTAVKAPAVEEMSALPEEISGLGHVSRGHPPAFYYDVTNTICALSPAEYGLPSEVTTSKQLWC